MSDWSLSRVLESLHSDIQNRLSAARSSFGHPGTKGDASERIWIEVFQKYLPQRYQAEKAHVVDSKGAFSQQIDVVVFDRQYSPFIFNFQGQLIVPAESVYAVFEAKQSIDASMVSYAQEKVASVRRLHRTSLPIPHAGGTYPAKPLIPILGGILTFESDWKPPLGEPLSNALSADHGHGRLELGCIASHGYFQFDEPAKRYALQTDEMPATSFLFKLIAQLQFSGTVPMIDIEAYGPLAYSRRLTLAAPHMSLDTPPMTTTFESLACEVTQQAEARRVPDQPTNDEVRGIMETVYFASLAREEGRLLRVRVGFIAPEGPGRPIASSWGWWVLPFATPVPFEKYSLVKLAPSVDARQSVIAVTRIDGRLFIWGLINNGTSTINLREGRTSRSMTTGPNFVDVEALIPGVLDVRIGSWTRRFSDGQVDLSPVHPFRPNGPLADLAKAGSSAARVTPGLWSRTLRLLLGEMQRAKHGGTLLLHADSAHDWDAHDLQVKHCVRGEGLVLTDACFVTSAREESYDDDSGRMTMAEVLPSEALTGNDADRMVLERSRDVHAEWLDAVRWVASLAAIDGALLLSRTFAVRAFGVIVESVSRVEVTHASGQVDAWQPFPWERFGTRHQSAAAFCMSHRGSVAFVVSQDGAISMFRYREGRVVMWRPCELLDLGSSMGEGDACSNPIAD